MKAGQESGASCRGGAGAGLNAGSGCRSGAGTRDLSGAGGTIAQAAAGAAAVLASLAADAALLAQAERLADELAAMVRRGGKLLVCGNGGSSCDAAHLAEELTGRFRRDRPPLPAIACTDAGHLTCTANDYGYEQVFARWVRALANPADVVLLISTSGQSPNLLHAASAARERGARVAGLLGRGGGPLAPLCDIALLAPGQASDRVQEAQKVLIHALVEALEARLGYG